MMLPSFVRRFGTSLLIKARLNRSFARNFLPWMMTSNLDSFTQAITYPYERSETSYLFMKGQVIQFSQIDFSSLEKSQVCRNNTSISVKEYMEKEHNLPFTSTMEWSNRIPVIGYGSNIAPDQLRRKYHVATLGEQNQQTEEDETCIPLPVIKAELQDFESVFAAQIASYGSIPATLAYSQGATVEIAITFLTQSQLDRMHTTEGGYDFVQLSHLQLHMLDKAILFKGSPKNATLDTTSLDECSETKIHTSKTENCIEPKTLGHLDVTTQELMFKQGLLTTAYAYVCKNGALLHPDKILNNRLIGLKEVKSRNRSILELSQQEMLQLVQLYTQDTEGENEDEECGKQKNESLKDFVLSHVHDPNLRRQRILQLQGLTFQSPWQTQSFHYNYFYLVRSAQGNIANPEGKKE